MNMMSFGARGFIAQASKGRFSKRTIGLLPNQKQQQNHYEQQYARYFSVLDHSSLHRGGSILSTNMNPKEATASIRMRQLFDDESCTYTYLLWDKSTFDAVLVDPVDVQVDRDLEAIRALGLNLVFAINTHAHADHITGTGLLKERVPGLASVISKASGAQSDLTVSHGDTIVFGNSGLSVRATPGHTEGCVSLVGTGNENDETLAPTFVLTGDALLVGGCGRTDFQGGCPETLWESVQQQLFVLPDTTVVYPAHDYKGRTHTTIGTEKTTNPRLGSENVRSRADFVHIMENLNLPYPKKLDVAVPANMRCGI